MQTIHVKHIVHRGEQRIGLFFDYDPLIIEQIKKIKGRRWSKSLHCWHLPHTTDAYAALEKHNIPFTIQKTTGTTEGESSKGDHTGIATQEESAHSVLLSGLTEKAADILPTRVGPLEITWNNKIFIISIRFDPRDLSFIKSLHGSWWSTFDKKWMVRSTIANLEALQKHFSYWTNDQYARLYDLLSLREDPLVVELYQVPEHRGQLAIRVKGYKADFDFLKGIPSRQYEREFRRWIIPHEKTVIERVKKHYEQLGAKIIDRISHTKAEINKQDPSLQAKQSHLLKKFAPGVRDVVEQYTDALIGQRYSWSTIRSYAGEFGKYLHHLSDLEIVLPESSSEDVNNYLNKMAGLKISDSLINTVTSAIKFYYQKVVFRPDFRIEKIKRPRRGKYLPTILSIQEVDALLRAVTNLKHVCLLYTIYSAGLRLNEVLSLRLQDIHWDRNQLFIKASKNKKDRMVMLSKTLKSVMKHYADQYQPVYWLFEGQGGKTQYSRSSVQQLIRRSAKKAGISRRVTPHTLRHCFATHLLDRGTDVRYIQELLGHKDISTTMIYTHVTTKNIGDIESPLDSLMNQKQNECL